MVKASDEILPSDEIHARLSADRRIYLRQESCWKLHIGHAAHVDRREEASDVPDHSAAECEQQAVAVGSCYRQLLRQRLDEAEPLVRLPARQKQDGGSLWKRSQYMLCPQSPD